MRSLHIDLDIDDYLNPKETIDRHMMGIDMKFMVERVGGTEVESSAEDDREVNYQEMDLIYSESTSEIHVDFGTVESEEFRTGLLLDRKTTMQ
jgi:hypothetical protein